MLVGDRSKVKGFVWEYCKVRIKRKILGRMFMGLFKINVNLPQLLYFVAFGVSWELSLPHRFGGMRDGA